MNMLRTHPWGYWTILFLIINIAMPQKGNPNPASRLAAMAAFCETRTFQIDDYTLERPLGWTNDWSRGPDGHFYSNKAPGPILIGLPVFWLIDQWVTAGATTPEARFLRRRMNLPVYNQFLSILFQIIPFAVLAVLLLRQL